MAEHQVFKIASIPADGVGKEVVAAGRKVLDALAAQSGGAFSFEWTEFPWGSAYYAEHAARHAADCSRAPEGTAPDRAERAGRPEGTAPQDAPRIVS